MQDMCLKQARSRNVRVAFSVCALLFSAVMATGQDPSELTKLDAENVNILKLLRATIQIAPTPPAGINESFFVTVGGIDQWITIRGQNRTNPVLLFLHGGPGEATNPWAYNIFTPWEKFFTVVQWDQRGAGKTLGKSGPSIASTITIEHMTQDGIELAEFLRGHLSKKKIILVGHSWGSILGTLMVKERPDLFHAYVGTGQVVDNSRGYLVNYHELVARARRDRNADAIRELLAIGPPPYDDAPRKQQVQRKWANEFEGSGPFLASTVGWAFMKPDSTLADVSNWGNGQILSGMQLFYPSSALNLQASARDFGIPMFYIQGADDYTCPAKLVREYFKEIKAPRKTLVLLKGGGHFAVFMQPRIFLNELVSRVRPLALK